MAGRRPSTTWSACDISPACWPGPTPTSPPTSSAPSSTGTSPSARPTRGAPALDETARRDYERRLAELDRQLDHADRLGDADRGRRAADERAALLERLRRDSGFGGRARRLSDDSERCRMRVSKAIHRAISRIERPTRCSVGRWRPESARGTSVATSPTRDSRSTGPCASPRSAACAASRWDTEHVPPDRSTSGAIRASPATAHGGATCPM